MSDKNENIKSVTLRVAIFFGLTTFTLCIAIFYIESILDDTYSVINSKDSTIQVLTKKIEAQNNKIELNEGQIKTLREELDIMQESETDEATD